MKLKLGQFNKKPIYYLVAANLIPLVGILFFDWSLFSVMFLYWLENVVIGFYNVLKMAKATGTEGNTVLVNGRPKHGKGPVISFFIMHFGIFTLVHGVFVFILFGSADFSLIGLLIAFLSLIISHGISYKTNFLDSKEYLKTSAGKLMAVPYGRVMVMHFIVVLSGFFVQGNSEGMVGVVAVILLKIILDYFSHLFERSLMSNNNKY